jgi:MFS family permease
MSQQAGATTNAAPKTAAYAWIILFALYMATLSATLNLFKVPPVMGNLIGKYNLSEGQAGLLMSVFSIMGFVLAIPAGYILKQIGIKMTGLLAVGSLIIGSGIGAIAGESLNLLFAGRFIEGIGMGLIMVTSPFAISVWFPLHNRALPTGIWASSVGVGNIITLLIAPSLVKPPSDLSPVWWATAGFSALSFLIFAILFRMPKQEEMSAAPAPAAATEEKPPSLAKGMANKDFWMVSISFGCYNLVVMALLTFFPRFLQGFRGYSAGWEKGILMNAGFVTALVMLASIFSGPGGGNISDRIGKRKIMILIPYILMTLTLFFPFTISVAMIPVWMIVFGIVGGPLAPIQLATVPEVARNPQFIGIGMSVAAVGQNIGMFIGPALFGAILDKLGRSMDASYAVAGYWMIPICIVGIIATLCIKSR